MYLLFYTTCFGLLAVFRYVCQGSKVLRGTLVATVALMTESVLGNRIYKVDLSPPSSAEVRISGTVLLFPPTHTSS